MRAFELREPRELQEACAVLAEHEEARPIAGGTALVLVMKQGLLTADLLVNLMKIREAREVTVAGDAIEIGALATMADVDRDPAVRGHVPVLAKACHEVANIRIRNVATVGGNLAHADYQEDPPTALLALDASVRLRSARGTRSVALDDFLKGTYLTALEAGELVEAVTIPLQDPSTTWTYLRFNTHSSEDRPSAGVAVGLRRQGDMCAELRVAVGAATPRPVRIRSAEEGAAGQPIGDELFDNVASAASASIQPIEDLGGDAGYKRRVVRALVRRALEACNEQAGGR